MIYIDRVLGIILEYVPLSHIGAVYSGYFPSSTLPFKGRVEGIYIYPPVEGRLFWSTLRCGTTIFYHPCHFDIGCRAPAATQLPCSQGPFNNRCQGELCVARPSLSNGPTLTIFGAHIRKFPPEHYWYVSRTTQNPKIRPPLLNAYRRRTSIAYYSSNKDSHYRGFAGG